MDVAVIGATGDIGRQICAQLIERRVVPTTSRLQLVGRRGVRRRPPPTDCGPTCATPTPSTRR
ncbi:hypothetical protein [Branchiibius cervicis]|uniref:Uncharacterized protein n=1 Tax=Branchiibius cervicis TaxID=908252 RepID=A0ABW2AVV7_9MICO